MCFCGIDINTTDSKGTKSDSVCNVIGRPCFVDLNECGDLVAMFCHLCRLGRAGCRGLSPQSNVMDK